MAFTRAGAIMPASLPLIGYWGTTPGVAKSVGNSGDYVSRIVTAGFASVLIVVAAPAAGVRGQIVPIWNPAFWAGPADRATVNGPTIITIPGCPVRCVLPVFGDELQLVLSVSPSPNSLAVRVYGIPTDAQARQYDVGRALIAQTMAVALPPFNISTVFIPVVMNGRVQVTTATNAAKLWECWLTSTVNLLGDQFVWAGNSDPTTGIIARTTTVRLGPVPTSLNVRNLDAAGLDFTATVVVVPD